MVLLPLPSAKMPSEARPRPEPNSFIPIAYSGTIDVVGQRFVMGLGPPRTLALVLLPLPLATFPSDA